MSTLKIRTVSRSYLIMFWTVRISVAALVRCPARCFYCASCWSVWLTVYNYVTDLVASVAQIQPRHIREQCAFRYAGFWCPVSFRLHDCAADRMRTRRCQHISGYFLRWPSAVVRTMWVSRVSGHPKNSDLGPQPNIRVFNDRLLAVAEAVQGGMAVASLGGHLSGGWHPKEKKSCGQIYKE